MSDLRTAAQQALEALGLWAAGRDMDAVALNDLIHRLEAALAEHFCDTHCTWADHAAGCVRAEPVAWAVYDIKHGGSKALHWPEQHSPNGDPSQFKAVPLYTAPPQRKPLDEDQMNEAYIYIWRNLPSDFGHTASEWVDVGVRYAERVHGITGEKDGSQG